MHGWGNLKMDPVNEVAFEIPQMIRTYMDGHVECLFDTDVVPPSVDLAIGVTSKDVVIDPDTEVSARLYLPDLTSLGPDNKIPVLVYYHGGGFFVGSAFSPNYHHYLNSLVARAGVLAVSVNYRLAPEHPIPTAYDDSWQALQWVVSASDEWLAEHGDTERVFVAGDSAGANIAHHLALRVGESGTGWMEGLVLVQPYFWGPQRIGSESEEQEGFLTASGVDAVWPFVCPDAAAGEEDTRLNPLAEGAPSLGELRCKRVLVTVAGRDMLRERGRAYYQGLKESGWEGEMEMLESEGEDHGFNLFVPECDKALELMDGVVAFLKR